ncbi:MAG: septum formation initiator family protein [Rhodococcus sp.]|nr:septum formation initiator family protein [Rhodococcus sp. (in: high G+C Gram-positive bacteria)]
MMVFPPLQNYLGQRARITRLEEQVAQAQSRVDDLQAELERWQDPDWIARQARSRLAYVFPGETAYRVIDPEYITDALAGAEVDPATAPTVLLGITEVPWYTAIWDSVQVADQVPLPVEPIVANPAELSNPEDSPADPAAPADPAEQVDPAAPEDSADPADQVDPAAPADPETP